MPKDIYFLLPDQITKTVFGGSGEVVDGAAAVLTLNRSGFLSVPKILNETSMCMKASKESHLAQDLRTRVIRGGDATYHAMGSVSQVCSFVKFAEKAARLVPQLLGWINAGVMWVVTLVHSILYLLCTLWDIIKIAIRLSWLNLGQLDPGDNRGDLRAFFGNPATTDRERQEQLGKILWSSILHLTYHSAVFLISLMVIVLTCLMPVIGFCLSLTMLVILNAVYAAGLGGDIYDYVHNPKMESVK